MTLVTAGNDNDGSVVPGTKSKALAVILDRKKKNVSYGSCIFFLLTSTSLGVEGSCTPAVCAAAAATSASVSVLDAATAIPLTGTSLRPRSVIIRHTDVSASGAVTGGKVSSDGIVLVRWF